MPNSLTAGLAYFSIVFSVAFVIGVLRTMVIAPAVGDLNAVLIEVPIVLAISWVVCTWVLHRIRVLQSSGRIAMGVSAFVLLMVAEVLLAILIGHRTVAEHFAQFRTAPVLIGLIGQLGFAVIPLVQHRQKRG